MRGVYKPGAAHLTEREQALFRAGELLLSRL